MRQNEHVHQIHTITCIGNGEYKFLINFTFPITFDGSEQHKKGKKQLYLASQVPTKTLKPSEIKVLPLVAQRIGNKAQHTLHHLTEMKRCNHLSRYTRLHELT